MTTFEAVVPPPLQEYVPPPVAVMVTFDFVHDSGPSLLTDGVKEGCTAMVTSFGTLLQVVLFCCATTHNFCGDVLTVVVGVKVLPMCIGTAPGFNTGFWL